MHKLFLIFGLVSTSSYATTLPCAEFCQTLYSQKPTGRRPPECICFTEVLPLNDEVFKPWGEMGPVLLFDETGIYYEPSQMYLANPTEPYYILNPLFDLHLKHHKNSRVLSKKYNENTHKNHKKTVDSAATNAFDTVYFHSKDEDNKDSKYFRSHNNNQYNYEFSEKHFADCSDYTVLKNARKHGKTKELQKNWGGAKFYRYDTLTNNEIEEICSHQATILNEDFDEMKNKISDGIGLKVQTAQNNQHLNITNQTHFIDPHLIDDTRASRFGVNNIEDTNFYSHALPAERIHFTITGNGKVNDNDRHTLANNFLHDNKLPNDIQTTPNIRQFDIHPISIPNYDTTPGIDKSEHFVPITTNFNFNTDNEVPSIESALVNSNSNLDIEQSTPINPQPDLRIEIEENNIQNTDININNNEEHTSITPIITNFDLYSEQHRPVHLNYIVDNQHYDKQAAPIVSYSNKENLENTIQGFHTDEEHFNNVRPNDIHHDNIQQSFKYNQPDVINYDQNQIETVPNRVKSTETQVVKPTNDISFDLENEGHKLGGNHNTYYHNDVTQDKTQSQRDNESHNDNLSITHDLNDSLRKIYPINLTQVDDNVSQINIVAVNTQATNDLEKTYIENEKDKPLLSELDRKGEFIPVNEEVQGKIFLTFGQRNVPAHFIQNSDGEVHIGINGTYVCEIINTGKSKSLIMDALCNCFKSGNCDTNSESAE